MEHLKLMSDDFLVLLAEMIDHFLHYAKIHAYSSHNLSDKVYRSEMIDKLTKLYHSTVEVVAWYNTPMFYCVVDGYLCTYGREDIDFGPLGCLDKEHIYDTIESVFRIFVINAYDQDSEGEDDMINEIDACQRREDEAIEKTLEHYKQMIDQFNFTHTNKPE